MKFSTPVELPTGMPAISHTDRILIMGSCFAENIGGLFAENKFRADVNPFGIIYNPSSIADALWKLLDGKPYVEDDLFCYGDTWHSFMHHGSFSGTTPESTMAKINERFCKAQEEVLNVDWLILTFGTSYVYVLKESGEVVSNCHKLPANCFDRYRLSVEEVLETYVPLIQALRARNPRVKLLFTVSPIRHLHDGLHANQLSKSVLLMAIERLEQQFPECVFYFPSYEIVVDELRDYRFYADDMVHLSNLAVSYLWECFGKTFFTKETFRVMDEVEALRRDMGHKPFRPDSEAYLRFLGQIELKIKQLNDKYPYLDFQKELELCRMRLKK